MRPNPWRRRRRRRWLSLLLWPWVTFTVRS